MKKEHIGAIQVALGATFWSFAGVLGKWLPWNAFTINGVRALVAVLLLGLSRRSLRVRMSRGTVLGALGVMLTSMLYMAAIKLTTSANAIVLQYAAPAFVILFCWLFYGQRPSRRSVVTACLIMLGVVLCFADKMGGGHFLGNLLAILSAVTFSLVFFCARMPNTDPSDYSLLGLMLCTPCLVSLFFDPAVSARPTEWLAALGLGVCLAGGYFFISKAMGKVSPVFTVLLSNLEPVLNPIWVALFLPSLGELPGGLSLVGALIVLVTAAVYSIAPGDR
ncbi:MAG: EamA family transporter [Clostridia bacterium]|nr:EamA family transporter [Clostridia bacterium]